jgi:hypothetical protein
LGGHSSLRSSSQDKAAGTWEQSPDGSNWEYWYDLELTPPLAWASFLSAGSFIFIPAGTPHGFRVGNVTSWKLNLCTPAAMVGYFDELREATRKEHVDPQLLSEIALRYSMEVLGPVPEGYA